MVGMGSTFTIPFAIANFVNSIRSVDDFFESPEAVLGVPLAVLPSGGIMVRPATGWLENLEVLVVDDVISNCKFVGLILKKKGLD